MKRPATLREAREVVFRARAAFEAGSETSHRWHCGPVYVDNGRHGRTAHSRASVWMVNGRDVASVTSDRELALIGNLYYATTQFVGRELVRWISDRGCGRDDDHDFWAIRLEYKQTPRNGHLVWQASLAEPKTKWG